MPLVEPQPETSPGPRLPLELIAMVVAHLYPHSVDLNHRPYSDLDKQALQACALVSRTLFAIVRPYLFRDVGYSFVRHDVSDEDSDDIEHNRRTFSMVYAFLRDHPAASQNIQRLYLRHYRYMGFSAFPETRVSMEYSEFLSLLEFVPNLQELCLIDIAIRRPPEVIYPISQRSLTRLSIVYKSYFDISAPGSSVVRVGLQELLACAGIIDELRLEGLRRLPWRIELIDTSLESPYTGQGSAGIPTLQRPAVTSLELGAQEHEQTVMTALRNGIQADRLRALVLMIPDPRRYASLLVYIGPQLEKLQIPVSEFPVYTASDFFVVWPCTNLRELALCVRLDEDHTGVPANGYESDSDEEAPTGGPLQALLVVLEGSQIALGRYPKLSKLILDVDLGWNDEAQTWARELGTVTPEQVNTDLDELLVSTVANTAIPAITIQWPRHSGRGEAYIRSLFPALNINGLLVFQTRP